MLGSLLSSECAAAPPSAPCTTDARRRTHSQISKILKGKKNSPEKLSTLGHKQVLGGWGGVGDVLTGRWALRRTRDGLSAGRRVQAMSSLKLNGTPVYVLT